MKINNSSNRLGEEMNQEFVDKIIAEVRAVAFSDITNHIEVVDSDLKLLSLGRSIKSVRSGNRSGVVMHNKTAALQLLAKIYGITSDFPVALASLQRFGVNLQQDDGGSWFVNNDSPASEQAQ